MKAAVCYTFGEPLVVEEVDLDPPQTGEVQVRVAATAVCHSDVHLLRGDWGGTLPIVAGHEAAGVVEAVGANVTTAKVGDRVVVSLLRSCGRCFHCTTGASHYCGGAFALDSESRLRNRDGKALTQGIRVGAFAESVIVDQSQVVPISPEIPLDRAALLGCGVITGAGAVWNTARVAASESVVVIGAGGVGLNAIQAAALSSASPIIAIDRVASKLETARHFGATHTFDASEHPRTVRKLTGRGADYAFVTVGVPEAVTQAQMMIRPGGTIVIVGMPPVKAALSLRMFDVVWSEQRIVGSRMGATRLHVDVPRLANLYLAGRLKLDELITARFPLDAVNDAIAAMETGVPLRNVIVFQKGWKAERPEG